jgi:hypothetical protein
MNLALDAELGEDESVYLYEHICACDSCAHEYAQLGRLLKVMRHCDAPTAPSHYWNDIWDNVRERASSPYKTWWTTYKLHLILSAVPIAAAIGISGMLFIANRQPRAMTLAEASRRHGMVIMSHPYSDVGLSMLAVSEGTVADYDKRDQE